MAESEKLKEINPGMSVNIVANVDVDKEIMEVRNAIVYDVEGSTIVLSQTNPPFTRFHIDREITVTYIVRDKNGLNRIGFSGKLVRIINDYQLSSSNAVQAISVLRRGALRLYDLRMHYRVSPKLDSNIWIRVGNERVRPIDISMGGARFCHSKSHTIESRTMINLVLEIESEKFNLEAKAVSVWYPSEAGRRSDLEYVSVQFMKMERTCSHSLSGKILAIQREQLSKDTED